MTTTTDRLDAIAAFLGAEPDEAPGYRCVTNAQAYDAMRRIASGKPMDPYAAGNYTVFVPGRLALVHGADWMALCTVSERGRLATIAAYATWEAV